MRSQQMFSKRQASAPSAGGGNRGDLKENPREGENSSGPDVGRKRTCSSIAGGDPTPIHNRRRKENSLSDDEKREEPAIKHQPEPTRVW